jgi:hypothetical protein
MGWGHHTLYIRALAAPVREARVGLVTPLLAGFAILLASACCEHTEPDHPCDELVAGGCNPTTVVKAPNELQPQDTSLELTLAVDDSYIYFTQRPDPVKAETILRRMPKIGGAPSEVGRAPNIGALLVDDKYVYYVQESRVLAKRPKQGGAPVILHPKGGGAASKIEAVDMDATRLYFVERTVKTEQKRLMSLSKAGGNAVVLLEAARIHRDIALGANHVYYLQSKPDIGIVRVPKSGGPVEKVVDGDVNAFEVAGGFLVWVSSVHAVLAQPETGGPRTWIGFGRSPIGDMDVAGSRVVWERKKIIESAPLAGGDTSVIAREGEGHMSGIPALVVDDASAYWIGTDAAIRTTGVSP